MTIGIAMFGLSDLGATPAQGISVTNAEFSTKIIAGNATLTAAGMTHPSVMCCDNSGNIYVADELRHAIFKITSNGVASVLAGKPGTSGDVANVDMLSARFNAPKGICCDKSGTVYVADNGNYKIKAIRNGKVFTMAGTVQGNVSGNGLDAKFYNPTVMAVDAKGTVFVVDGNNRSTIRKVFANGDTITLTGKGGIADDATGDQENVRAAAGQAQLGGIYGLAVDKNGVLFATCSDRTGGYKIKMIDTKNWIYLHSGEGTKGSYLGDAGNEPYTCQYGVMQYGIANDNSRNCYLIDRQDSGVTRLMSVNEVGKPSWVINFEPGTPVRSSSFIYTIIDPSQKLLVCYDDA